MVPRAMAAPDTSPTTRAMMSDELAEEPPEEGGGGDTRGGGGAHAGREDEPVGSHSPSLPTALQGRQQRGQLQRLQYCGKPGERSLGVL